MDLKITDKLNKKNNKELIEFYNTNNINHINYVKQKDNLVIFTYNVHGWININDDININDNFTNIINLIKNIDIDILILQEVCFNNILSKNYILDQFNKIGFIDHFTVNNGGCFLKAKTCDNILILSKTKIINKKEIDVTCGYFKRCVSIVTIDGIKLCAVHLEIGKRYHHLPINNRYREQIEKNNTDNRINQLNNIINQNSDSDIDIIIGDFNFSFKDPEFNWLTDNQFCYYGDYENTTPYNKTDMIFIKNSSKIKYVNSVSIKCNYSDHLPVICEINVTDI